jgi:hypothetical protein
VSVSSSKSNYPFRSQLAYKPKNKPALKPLQQLKCAEDSFDAPEEFEDAFISNKSSEIRTTTISGCSRIEK